MKRRPQKRRGILLLIVLSLLVLFVLIGVTFVVVANQYTRSAIAAGKYEMTGDDPSQELDSALYSILRGSANPGDLTYRHSILSDLYGRDGFIGTVTAVAPEAQGEFLRIAFQTVGGSALRGSDYYAGSVLTLMDGNGRGHSTRVVRFNAFDPNVSGPTIVVTGFESLPNFAPKVSERFLVNGRPFNGTGDGYQPQAGSLRKTQTNYLAEVALLPNMRESQFFGSMLGDSDESWDAPDYQNYFLARIPTGANTSQRNDPLIPSFHRPFLINYWINRFEDGGLKWDGPDLDPFRNFIISRPLPRFHPLFTGSNPAFDRSFDTDGDGVPDAYDSDLDGDDAVDANLLSNLPILNGPWDVDNDNDGIADSIWVDLGMPVKMAPDGRLYKPLFAILCVDLDGRLNLNAHDNPVRVTLLQQPLQNQPNLAASPQSQLNEISNLTRGQGYGPAEIQLSGAVPDVWEIFENRYAEMTTSHLVPGSFNPQLDPLSAVKQWDMTNDYVNQARDGGSAYQSPSDLRGVGGVFLDHAGNPHYKLMGAQNETFDDPYETNLVTPNANDTTFTYAEQEQLLRAFDSDSMGIGSRLRDLFQAQWISDPHRLRRFTTHSFEIGTPNTVPPTESFRRIRDANDNRLLNPQVTVSDLVRARLIANGFANTDPLKVEEQVRLMVPSEIRQGRRMDVNRWLGNARDDNGNGVVDEPGEDSTSSRMWANTPFEANGQFAIDDPHYKPPNAIDATNVNNPHFAKQVYARQLYCLAMLLIDSRNGVASGQSGSDFVFESLIHNLNPNDSREITARRIAQWAINVVDFRDPDAIMTPFEFDLQPFDDDGWGVDDDFTSKKSNESDRGVVWGCEHPELIITETTAFHDRRVKDTDNDTTMTPRLPPDDADEEFVPDDDLDQYRIPQGSLFLELFCMRNRFQNNSQAPPELYVKNNNTGQVFLDLGRVVNGSPVWRVAIGDPPEPGNTTGENAVKLPAVPRQDRNYENNNNNQPFDPNDEALLAGLRSTGIPTATFERFVIFSNTIPTNVPAGTYYYNRRGWNTRLEPGQYAVIGPREITGLGSKRNAAPNTSSEISDQQIVLGPNAVAFPQTILNTNQNVENTNGPNLMNRRPVVGIIAAADIPLWNEPELLQYGAGLSVSEPLPAAYYQEPTWPDDGSELPSYYDNPEAPLNTLPDEPYDQRPGRPLEESPELLMTGTHEDFRVAVLQRLADPTKAYHPVRNPYVSLDAQTIDLTVFNGEDRSTADPPPEWDQWEAQYGDYDPSDDPDLAPEVIFRTRERGTPRIGVSMLWNPLTLPLQQAGQGPPPMQNNTYWSERLVHTLGHLNRSLYNGVYPARIAGITANADLKLRYIGDPQASHLFPWLVWNNRPFVSHFELMQVPSAPPWRLLYEFRGRNPRNNVDIYEESDGNFSHLLNFTQSKEGSSGTHANLSRLFDYLEVPSRFVGAEHWFNPATFSNIQNMTSPDLHGFATPFNRVSKFRNPGKVNINTIPDQTVWTGIEPSQPQKWNEIEQSLRGDLPTDKRPAFYSNPVRSASAADLMPLSELERDPVQATLLRSNDAGDEMLFSFELNESQRYNSPEHNSYFAYHRLQRLGNLLTTHSNVYAVWITVGYFEVHPWNPNNPLNTNLPPVIDAEHPDGYQLGLELGSDTGETRRHRAFYMIDRSIPVGFQPGENHNVDEAVVLRRMLE